MAINCQEQRIYKAGNNNIAIINFLRSRAFIFTLLIHLSLILLLINLSNQQRPIKTLQPLSKKKITAIKSYLYRNPIKQQPALSKAETAPSTQNNNIKETDTIKKLSTPAIPDKLIPSPKAKVNNQLANTMKKAISPIEQSLKSPTTKNKNKKLTFSALVQLKKLQQQLDQQSITSESNYYNRPRGKSVFNDLPAAVKHSQKQLTASEKRKKMTTHLGANTIVKNSDGNCTLIQDLSNVGMEGITAISGFKCGQTKMEKSYDAHMNKVLEKLGKKK